MPTNQSILLLPRDILVKILLLLPFESIPVCKLVSKELKNLTDDPKFLNRFASLAFFYIENTAYCVTRKECNREIAGRNPPFAVNSIAIDLQDDDFIPHLLSESCSGTACFVAESGRLFLYNSITGAVTNAAEQVKSVSSCVCYGFGYDRYSDDYKLMVFWERDGSLFWAYSFRDDAWRSFEGFPSAAYFWPNFHRFRQACSFNGVLHWVVRPRYKGPRDVIVTYDLQARRFGEMQLPPLTWPAYLDPLVVAEFGGRPCCWNHPERSILSVWTMGEYGVSESWTRLVRIDLYRLNRDFNRQYMVKPMMLYKCQDGRKLMLMICKIYGMLYWYDIDNEKVTQIQKNAWEKRSNRKQEAQEIN